MKPALPTLFGVLWLALNPGFVPRLTAAGGPPPNILFIMVDQMRWDALGANGNPLVRTPNLDRLADGGAHLTHAFVQAPVCVPSRVTFFTGRYPHSHKNRVNYTPLDEREILLPERLRQAGYATAAVGKLHLMPPTPEEGRRRGFDVVELHDGVPYLDAFSDYVKWRRDHDPLWQLPYRKLARDIEPGRNPFRSVIAAEHTDTAWVGLRSRHHLERLADGKRPFFLFASFWKPHSPFEVAEPFDRLFDKVEFPLPPKIDLERIHQLPPPLQALILRGKKPPYDLDRDQLQWIYRSYHASVTHLDKEIGALLDTLKRSGSEKDTIVVFTTDHGDQLLRHGLMGKNCFFEDSVRIPLIVSRPGQVVPGKYDALVGAVDVLASLFELAGLPAPLDNQGRSFAPLISGNPEAYQPKEAVFGENVIPEVITRGLDFVFVPGQGVKGIRHPDAKMVRTRNWKYVHYPDGYAELYDLGSDPGETRNLAGQASSQPKEQEMKDRLLKWLITADETDQIAPRWEVK